MLKTIRTIAFINFLVVGLFGLGLAQHFLGSPWTTVLIVWSVVWGAIAFTAFLLDDESDDDLRSPPSDYPKTAYWD